ncbi:Phenylcoumaran benzylic ether reductase 1 [Citrus sinensis]|uniref:Phenylcoumaran benzylic ether reductase 1 n=1 Tax=Citrus sinensis TaxID=2711 RepID=A0ACB8IGL0_CITSI|nr:Phenylcoumaran benzylic ether reductase 1 [Citrus sinensis]
MASKSKILSIGGTGYIGKFIVEASVKAGHQTFVLVRESTLSDPSKSQLLDHFKNLGVNFVIGDVLNQESLVKAIKQVDVVISTVGHTLIADQVKIIAAIKEAGNVKILPVGIWIDDDRIHGAVEPAKSTNVVKAKIRRAVEAEGIPYTYVASYCLNGHFLPNLSQPEATAPPRDKVVILGDGNPKEAAPPLGRLLSIYHSAFVEGVQTDFKIEPSFGVEASQLYPDVKYTTVDEYLNQFV